MAPMAGEKAASRALEPLVARAIIEAFEGACDVLRAQGRTLNEKMLGQVATAVIDLAESGTTCPVELKRAALKQFGVHL